VRICGKPDEPYGESDDSHSAGSIIYAEVFRLARMSVDGTLIETRVGAAGSGMQNHRKEPGATPGWGSIGEPALCRIPREIVPSCKSSTGTVLIRSRVDVARAAATAEVHAIRTNEGATLRRAVVNENEEKWGVTESNLAPSD